MKTGDKFERSFTLSDKIYNGFIDLFNDKNPMHVDEEYARSKGFRSKVMHGNILNGFISFMAGECLPEKNILLISQEINYKKPVYMYDTLKLNLEIVNMSESVNVADFSFTFLKDKNIKVASGKFQIKILK
jgi:3-hydroxybutyryl-CoA dehydratase